MPILDIIDQIDAYLSSLRLARDLLSKSLAGPQGKGVVRKKAKTDPIVPTKSRVRTASRAKVQSAPRAGAKRVAVANIPSFPAPQVEALAPLPAVTLKTAPERLPLPNVGRGRLRYGGPRRSTKPSHARNLRASEPRSRASFESAKPAIALAGPVNSKIVVVSAEQARQDRERTAPSENRPRSIRGSGLTGRLAFEALFQDKRDRSS
jgi:hypothetical protein